MAILADENVRVIVQGITGREASTFTKDISIGGFTCNDINQIRVVAFVSYGSGVNFFTVINSMSCAWSEEKDYELEVK